MKRYIYKSIIFVLLSIGFSLTDCFASGRGTTGANFLKIAVGARPLGMGGAFVAVADDVNTVWWNPAGVATIKRKEATLMHNEMGEDISYQFLAYNQPVRKLRGGLGGSISYLSVSDIQGYSPGGIKTKKLSTYDLAISLCYGLKIVPSVSGGINFKFIAEKLADKKASTCALDIGGLWNTPVSGLQLGFNIQNLGGGIKFIQERSSLPLNGKLGCAYEFKFFGAQSIVAVDVNIPVDYSVFVNGGVECKIYDLIALRAGFKSKDDLSSGLRLGIGIGGKNLAVDYSWLSRGDFEDSHRMSATLRFGREYEESMIERDIKEHFERGKKYFNNGQMLKAHREFKTILLVSPGHKGARDFISRIEVSVEQVEVAKDIANFFTQGEKYYKKGDLISARAMFEEIIALNPDHREAKNYINTIEQRFGEVVDSIFGRGVSYYEQANYLKALDDMKKVLTLNPEHEKAKQYVTLIEDKLRELEKIKLELRMKQEEKRKRRKISASLKKGLSYYESKQWVKAINSFNEILALAPDHKVALKHIVICYYAQGLTLYKEGKLLEALHMFNNVLRLYPEHEEAQKKISQVNEECKEKAEEYNRQGLVEYTKGNLKEAIEAWENALRFYPDLETARKNLERAQKEINK
ncbi:PorV/PorQ family protein [bacterium]|nr:PorV/PorQ family protein [bacterium]NIO18844.1 PorV/PorQ family protein [bacterium]